MSKSEDKVLVYGEYSKLIDTIMNLDSEQTRYRYTSSQYMLGSFAVLGVLYFTKLNIAHFAPLIIAVAVPWFAILLITPNLLFDLSFLEKLKLSCLSEAITYERKHKWLPNYHRCLIDQNTGHHHGGSHQKINFYLGIVLFEMIISGLSACILLLNKPLWLTCLPILLIVVFYFIYRFSVFKIVGESYKILKELEDMTSGL